MKFFKCKKHGLSKDAVADVTVEVEFHLYNNCAQPKADYVSSEDIDVQDVVFLCIKCREPVKIVDKECPHKWGDIEYGYGDNNGRARQRCELCGASRVGRLEPEWEDVEL